MDEGLSGSEEVVRQVLGGSGGGGDLCNSIGYVTPSLPSSDENKNRLREEEVEEEDEEGWLQQDSMNNNEKMDNRSCPQNLSALHKDSPSSTQHSTGDKAEGAPESVPASDPSSLLALLQELQEDGDHPRFPHRLHQIAEAYFLVKDYEQAVQLIQLERLYHERLLSNLAALQEHWESRWDTGSQGVSQPQGRTHTDLRPAQLETLNHICRTHQRPSLSVEERLAVNRVLKIRSRTGGDTAGATSLPCSARSGAVSGRLMEEQQATEEVRPAHGEDASVPNHQRVPLCNSDSSPPLVDTPTSPVPSPSDCGGDGSERDATKKRLDAKEQMTDSSSWARPGPTDAHLEAPPLGVDPGTEEGCGSQAGDERMGPKPAATGTGDGQGDSPDGMDSYLVDAEGFEAMEGEEEEEGEVEKEEIPEDEFEAEEDEFEDETLAVSGMGVASLDELAKRIKVEQTAPTQGLVSILKRRSLLEGSPPQPTDPPKPAPKRKVRFCEPEDTADPDDVGLDSCLLLLLLCMVTMVISVGGTALYCTLADAQSSVCTDFSRNVDFYLSQVQRGLDEIRHWLAPGS